LAQKIAELEQRISQMEMLNAELTNELDETKTALRNERQKHEKELAAMEQQVDIYLVNSFGNISFYGKISNLLLILKMTSS
jgi:hypothetical protein